MFKSFKNYKKQRDSQEINERIDYIAEGIAISGLSFKEAWEDHFFPTLLENRCETVEDSLEEIEHVLLERGYLGKILDAIRGKKSGGDSSAPSSQSHGSAGKAWGGGKDVGKAKEYIQEVLPEIRQRLQTKLKEFATDVAKNYGGDIGYQIARVMQKQALKAVDTGIDKGAEEDGAYSPYAGEHGHGADYQQAMDWDQQAGAPEAAPVEPPLGAGAPAGPAAGPALGAGAPPAPAIGPDGSQLGDDPMEKQAAAWAGGDDMGGALDPSVTDVSAGGFDPNVADTGAGGFDPNVADTGANQFDPNAMADVPATPSVPSRNPYVPTPGEGRAVAAAKNPRIGRRSVTPIGG